MEGLRGAIIALTQTIHPQARAAAPYAGWALRAMRVATVPQKAQREKSHNGALGSLHSCHLSFVDQTVGRRRWLILVVQGRNLPRLRGRINYGRSVGAPHLKRRVRQYCDVYGDVRRDAVAVISRSVRPAVVDPLGGALRRCRILPEAV